MQNENFIEKISTNFNQSATIKNVFGEAVHTGEKIIIPVANVAYGFGGGLGQGLQKPGEEKWGNAGPGGGAGGGLRACAKGIYEITPVRTRFIPASPFRHILFGFVIGIVVKTLFLSGR
ncbi:MAG TPA: spore germination protein GerW family protein [Flavisolibacter sp.]